MKILLDTHALLWWLGEDSRLGPRARATIADPANDIFVSQVSLWEIAIKVGIGKLRLDIDAAITAIRARGLAELGMTRRHLIALAALERHHRDPFDHMLIAQAVVEGAALMTEDRRIGDYPVKTASCG